MHVAGTSGGGSLHKPAADRSRRPDETYFFVLHAHLKGKNVLRRKLFKCSCDAVACVNTRRASGRESVATGAADVRLRMN
jgi:hypothetical protein